MNGRVRVPAQTIMIIKTLIEMKRVVVITSLLMTGMVCGQPDATIRNLPDPAVDLTTMPDDGLQMAVFAGGCFWCTEAVFEQLEGVTEVISGYTGGKPENANYQSVSAGSTDHAEVIRITYNPARISYGRLLKVFFAVAHNPTQLDRQGPDVGRQYRSAIFYATPEQQKVAGAYIQQLEQAQIFDQPIATTLEPLNGFYAAEQYHQDFVRRHPEHPYVQQQALPKVKKMQKLFAQHLKQAPKD